jgi:hypothetical protein
MREAVPGLNAVGKPFGANYDPHYKLSFGGTKPGRLYAPYRRGMKFVGDPPKTESGRSRRRRPPPAPLLGDSENSPARKTEAALQAALKKTNELRQCLLALQAAYSADGEVL